MTTQGRDLGLRSVGEYDLLRKIAGGGMGTVYEGRHRATGRPVAVKVVTLPARERDRGVTLERFAQEFRAARALEHPNLVRALDFGWEGRTPYLVMEYVDGETLGDRIEREGALPEAEAVRIVTQVAEALAAVHGRGLVHRDVKPDNVLLGADGQAKLADLGLVKGPDARPDLTRAGRGLGTPNFAAPEQSRDARHADARADVYGLGATLYMAVTGELPFGDCSVVDGWAKKLKGELPPPRQFAPGLSEQTERAILRAMHPDPARRPASCRDFIEELTKAPPAARVELAPAEAAGEDSRPGLVAVRARASVTRQRRRVCPPTSARSCGPGSLRLTRAQPPTRGNASTPPGTASAVLTWALLALGLAAGLLSGLYFFLR